MHLGSDFLDIYQVYSLSNGGDPRSCPLTCVTCANQVVEPVLLQERQDYKDKPLTRQVPHNPSLTLAKLSVY